MAVSFIPVGAILGGLTRKDNDDCTCACRAQGTNEATQVKVELSYNASYSPLVPGTYTPGTTDAANNYTATAYFTGQLQPNRTIYWRARLEGTGGPVYGSAPLTGGQFSAPPSKYRPRNWRISSIGCTQIHDSSTNANVRSYYVQLLRRIGQLAGDGLIHLGDTWYPEVFITTPGYADYVIGEGYEIDLNTAPADATVPRIRTDVMTMLAATHHVYGLGYSAAHLYAAQPLWCLADDHEFIQPAQGGYPPPAGSIYEKGKQVGYQVYGEYFSRLNKLLTEQDGSTYSDEWLTPVMWHRWNYWPVEFIYPDCRGYQNAIGADTPSKTLATEWTQPQVDWFKERLRVSTAPIIAIVLTIDLCGKHGTNLSLATGDNFTASSYARDELLEYVWTIRGYRPVVFIAGDTHNQSVTVYEGKTGNRPRLWSFCASHGVAANGHGETIGWMGRLMGLASYEGQGKTGWGGKPIMNIGSLKFTNNLLTLDAGFDGRGPYIRPTIWVTWPDNNVFSSAPPRPIFTHEFRSAA